MQTFFASCAQGLEDILCKEAELSNIYQYKIKKSGAELNSNFEINIPLFS